MTEFERLLDGPLTPPPPIQDHSYSEVSTKRIEVILVPPPPPPPASVHPLVAIGWFILVAVVVAALT